MKGRASTGDEGDRKAGWETGAPEALLLPAEFAARVRRDERTVRRWAQSRRFAGAVIVAGRLVGFHWGTFLAGSK